MVYTDDDFELVSNTEIDLLLVDLPFDLIKENLRYQINNPLSSNVNYVENVIEKISFIKDEYAENDDVLENVENMTMNFFGFLIQELDNKFNLCVTEELEDPDTYMSVGTSLYNFLILRYKKNITRFIYRFILKNKKLLVEEFESSYKKKDVTSIAIKKKIKNKDDILILSNLPSIIKFIMSLELEPLDFIKYASSDENYEANQLKNLINEGKIVGNFVSPYLSTMMYDYNDVMDEIQTDVKMKLIKKAQ